MNSIVKRKWIFCDDICQGWIDVDTWGVITDACNVFLRFVGQRESWFMFWLGTSFQIVVRKPEDNTEKSYDPE